MSKKKDESLTDWYALLNESEKKEPSAKRAPSTNKVKASTNTGDVSTNASTNKTIQAPTNRRQRWRENHPEKYRAYQREYMRKRRAQ